MASEFKIDRNEIVALLLVFFISLGIGHFPAKNTLPDFSVASAIQNYPSAASVQPLHIRAVYYLESAYASVLGVPQSSPQAIVSSLLFFPPVLLALTSLFLYLSVRTLGFGRAISAFSTLLFASSLAAFQFLPGVYGPVQLAAPLFALFLFHFASFASKDKLLMLIPAAIFAAASAYLSPAFGIAAIATVAVFAVPLLGKEDNRLAYFGAMLLLAAAAIYLSPDNQPLYFNLQGLQSFYRLAPFLLAAASLSVAAFFLANAKLQYALLAAAGALLSAFNPVASALLLAISSAEGVKISLSEKTPKSALLAFALFLAFFTVLGIVPESDFYKAAAISLVVAILFPIILHLYEYKNVAIFSVFFLAVFSLSLFSGAFYSSVPQQRSAYPNYADKDLSEALSSLSGKNAASIYLFGFADAAKFYLPSAKIESQQELSSFLVSGKPVLPKGSVLVVSLSDIDDAYSLYSNGTPQFTSFRFVSNFSSGGSQFAIFVSTQGTALAYEVDSQGKLALSDPQLIDQYGRSYGSVPLSRAMLLSSSKHFSSPQNRLLVLEEGAQIPYLLNIYSEKEQGVARLSEFGQVSVFKVE
jgi:hypothetical protein